MPKKKQQERDSKGRFKSWGNGGNDIWTPIGSRTFGAGYADVFGSQPAPGVVDLLNAFEDTVYSVVNLIAHNVSSVDYRLCATTARGQDSPKCLTKALPHATRRGIEKSYRQWTRKADDVQEVTDHPLLDLIDKPNPNQSFHKLLSMTQTYLELTGSAFWYLARNRLGLVSEIWLLPTQSVQIERDEDNRVTGYTNGFGEREETLSPEDVLHIKFPNPADPNGYGLAPLRAVWQRVMLLRQEQSSWQAVLSNMAFPSALVYPPAGETFTEDQATRIARQITERFRMGEQGGVWVVQDHFDYQTVSTPPKDLSALQLYDQIKTSICNAWSVPRPLLDMQDSNFASADTARRAFQEFCIEPRVRLILEAINHRLCPPRLFLCADDVIQADRTYELQNRSQVVQEVTANLRSINEGREALGLGPVAGGDKFAYQIAPPTFTGFPAIPSGHDKTVTVPTKKAAPGVQPYTSTVPDPLPLANALREFFERQAGQVTARLKTATGVEAKAFVPIESWTDDMRRTLTPVLRAYFDQGTNSVLAAVGSEAGVPLLAVQELDKAVNASVLALAQSTLGTTDRTIADAVDLLREAVRQGLSQNEADAELAKRVNAIFTDLSQRHSRTIAETESTRAKHAGELIAVKAAGVECRKKWLPDSMACPVCREMAAKGSVELDTPFARLGDGPYSVVDHPPAHPSCRCTLQYEFTNLEA